MPDQGQIWSSRFQIGREAVSGLAVPATRKAYFETSSQLQVTETATEHRFAVGRPDNLLDITPGAIEASGTVSMPVSAAESLELFLTALQGGVTPTVLAGGTLVQEWVIKPSVNQDSMTVEWDDGSDIWQAAGTKVNQLQITGDASGTNMISADLFSNDVIPMPGGVMTVGPTDRVPDFLEGWQARLFIGSFGQAFSALDMMPGLLRNWTLTVINNLGRVRTADLTRATRRLTRGELAITAALTFDSYGFGAIREFNNWRAGTRRAIGLEFMGPPAGIEAGVNEVQTISFGTQTAGSWIPSFMGQAGPAIAWNATAAAIQTALRAIPTIGPEADVNTTGGASPTTPVVATFVNRWGEYNVPLITANTTGLTGGTPSVTVAQTTAGRSGRRRIGILMPGKWVARTPGSADNIRTAEMSFTSIYDPAIAAMAEFRIQNERATAF